MGQQLAAPLGTGVLHFVRRVSICARCELPRRLSSSDYGSRRRAPTPQPHLYANVLFGAPRGSLEPQPKRARYGGMGGCHVRTGARSTQHGHRDLLRQQRDVQIFSTRGQVLEPVLRGSAHPAVAVDDAPYPRDSILDPRRRPMARGYVVANVPSHGRVDPQPTSFRGARAAPFGRPPAHARSLRERAHDTVPAVHQPLPGRWSMRSRCVEHRLLPPPAQMRLPLREPSVVHHGEVSPGGRGPGSHRGGSPPVANRQAVGSPLWRLWCGPIKVCVPHPQLFHPVSSANYRGAPLAPNWIPIFSIVSGRTSKVAKFREAWSTNLRSATTTRPLVSVVEMASAATSTRRSSARSSSGSPTTTSKQRAKTFAEPSNGSPSHYLDRFHRVSPPFGLLVRQSQRLRYCRTVAISI